MAWCAIFICFDCWTTGAGEKVISSARIKAEGGMVTASDRAYSSFIMIARSVGVNPILTQFCLFIAASPMFGEWKMCWPVQSRSGSQPTVRSPYIRWRGSDVERFILCTIGNPAAVLASSRLRKAPVILVKLMVLEKRRLRKGFL